MVDRKIALLELEGQLVDDIDADGEGVGAFYANVDRVVVAIAEAATETSLGSNGLLVPKQDDVGQRSQEQQQHQPPPHRIERSEAEAGTRYEGNSEQQKVEAAS